VPKQTHTRKRSRPGFRNEGRIWNSEKLGGFISGEQKRSRRAAGKQITVSEGHRWPPPSSGELSDEGGPFYTEKSYVEGKHTRHINIRYDHPQLSWYINYEGDMSCNPVITVDGSIFPPSLAASDSELSAAGATAIARCSPTNSVAEVSTFLGELVKDGLPSVPLLRSLESRARAAVKAGDEFLNAAFGWTPLVNDVKDISNAAKHADAVLAQYERDSGRVVRRRYNFPPENTTSEGLVATNTTAMMAGGSPILADISGVRGDLVRKVETSRRRWFSGAFTYYLPADYDSRKRMAGDASEADKLLGTSLTPEVLWELAPWSWAIDWFSNTGDVIHNVSAWESAGLVMRYGYIMEHTVHKWTYSMNAAGLETLAHSPVPPLVLVTESKKRVPANPFGFGVTWEGLSPFQGSVLAALGITRRG
jgi:hypothetical protein